MSALGAVLGLASLAIGIISADNTGAHMPSSPTNESSVNQPVAIVSKPGIRSLAYSAGADGSGQVFLGYQDGILVSPDQGITWQAVDSPGAGAVSLATQGLQQLFMVRGSDIYRSNDVGVSWQTANSPVLGTAIRALSTSNAAPLFAAVADRGIYSTSNEGVMWQRLPLSPILPVTALATGESQALFAATTGGMVLETSDNGSTWRSTGSGLGAAEVTGLALDQYTGDLYASTTRGLYHLPGGSNRWQRTSLGVALVATAIGGKSHTTLLAVTSRGEVFRSLDSGVTWGP